MFPVRIVQSAAALSAAVMGVSLTTGIARAADDHWTNNSNDFLWKTAANWGNGAMPLATETALFDGSPASGIGTVNLEGFTRSLVGLRFTNAFPQAGYTISNGALNLASIENDGYTNFPNNTVAANVTASGSTLTLIANAGYLDVTGRVTTNNLAVTATFPGNGTVALKNTNNSIGHVTIGGGATLSAYEPGSLGPAGDVTINNGLLTLYTALAFASFQNPVTVASASTTISGFGPAGGTVQLYTLKTGTSSIDYETSAGGVLQFQNVSLSGNPTFSTSVSDGAVRLNNVVETVAGSSINVTHGHVLLGGLAQHTGGNNVLARGFLEVVDPLAHGAGASNVSRDGVLKFDVAMSTFPAVNVAGFGALIGDMTGAHYSGASQNVLLAENAILDTTGGGVMPVRGVDVDHAAYYQAIVQSNQNASIAGPSSVFKGIAFGAYSPAAAFTGTVTDGPPGAGIEVYVASGTAVTIHGATFNTFNPTPGVTFSGSGEAVFDAAPAGSARVYSFIGNGDASTQTTFLADLLAPNVVTNAKSFNVSNGILYVGAANAVAPGSTVNVKSGGTLLLFDGASPAVKPSTGSYVIQDGGILFLNDAAAGMDGGATFQFQAGGAIVATTNVTIPVNNPNLATTWVLADSAPIAVTGAAGHVRLGTGDRLTTGPDNDATLSGSGGVKPAPLGSALMYITAATGHTLTVNDNVQVGPGLQVGDTAPYLATGADLVRQSVSQDGNVVLNGAVTGAATLVVAAGNLTIGNDAADIFSNIEFTQNSAGTTTINSGTANLKTVTVNVGLLGIGSKVNYSAGASIAVNGGTLTLVPTAKPTMGSGTPTMTIAAGATVNALGGVDSFTDDNATPADPSDDRTMNVVNNGTLNIAPSVKRIGNLSGTGTTELGIAAGNSLLTVQTIEQGTLGVHGWKVALQPNGAKASKVGTLASMVGNSAVDIANNAFVIDYTGATVIDSVRGWLQTGRNGGAWNGAGVRFTSANAAGDAQQRTGIAFAEASSLIGLSGSQTATWNGVTVDATSVLVKYTWYGDANVNGKVDLDDYALVDRGFARHLAGWNNGDFDYDGSVTSADYLLMDRVFVQQSGGLAPELLSLRESQFGEAYVSALVASVPEPAGFVGIGMAAIALRRKRSLRAKD